MSATNRGSKRVESDFYATPEYIVTKFLNHYDVDFNSLRVMEAFAGNGNMCRAIKNKYPKCSIWANEIRGEERVNLMQCSNQITMWDFLNIDNIDGVDIVMSNPPYSIAQECIEHCFKIKNPNTTVIMLLRLAFLESKKRYEFWQRHPVNKLYVLSERPSFMQNGKTDATAYAFFVFDNSNTQEIKII
jgi:16S rRNA A1518/A1519 N6-dimethyltransferase RsmA/KsgA/DIM1 with predicted DNA glycosylase/AP lyase activity